MWGWPQRAPGPRRCGGGGPGCEGHTSFALFVHAPQDGLCGDGDDEHVDVVVGDEALDYGAGFALQDGARAVAALVGDARGVRRCRRVPGGNIGSCRGGGCSVGLARVQACGCRGQGGAIQGGGGVAARACRPGAAARGWPDDFCDSREHRVSVDLRHSERTLSTCMGAGPWKETARRVCSGKRHRTCGCNNLHMSINCAQ